MQGEQANNYLLLQLTVFNIFDIHFAGHKLNLNITLAIETLAPPATVLLPTFNFFQRIINDRAILGTKLF